MHITRFILLLCCMLAGATCAYAQGVVTQVAGQVELQRGEDIFAVEEGLEVVPGDIISTAKNASVQLDMDDGSSVSLGSESTLRIKDYRLRKDKSVLSAAFDKITGWLRFSVSKLRKPEKSSYRFHMPTAVMGVRGTEGVLHVTGEGDSLESHVMLEQGEVEVAEKAEHDRLVGPRVRLKSGQYASRRHARILRKLQRHPGWLRKRMPLRLKHRIKRRIKFLKRRGVPPRHIRKIMRRDIKRHLRKHPEKRKRLKRRMDGQLEEHPKARKRMKQRRERKRERRRERRR